jgi:hypothetical protein
MNIKTLGTVAVVTAAITTSAFAQYGPPVRGPIHYGKSYYGPAYGMRTFRGVYNQMPGPLIYGDGWVPESHLGPFESWWRGPYNPPVWKLKLRGSLHGDIPIELFL